MKNRAIIDEIKKITMGLSFETIVGTVSDPDVGAPAAPVIRHVTVSIEISDGRNASMTLPPGADPELALLACAYQAMGFFGLRVSVVNTFPSSSQFKFSDEIKPDRPIPNAFIVPLRVNYSIGEIPRYVAPEHRPLVSLDIDWDAARREAARFDAWHRRHPGLLKIAKQIASPDYSPISVSKLQGYPTGPCGAVCSGFGCDRDECPLQPDR